MGGTLHRGRLTGHDSTILIPGSIAMYVSQAAPEQQNCGSLSSESPMWKLKIDTKKCDLEKAALYVYNSVCIYMASLGTVSILNFQDSFVQESAWRFFAEVPPFAPRLVMAPTRRRRRA